MILIPLSLTQVNWQQFLATVSDTESRDLGRCLDIAGIKTGSPAAYYKVLREFAITPSEAKVQRFLRFAFLTDIDFNAYKFDLNVLYGKRLRILDGDLTQWKTAVEYGCSQQAEGEDTVEFFNGVLQFFESAGLKDIWSDCRKSDLGNGLFLLEQR
jgi:hypothetical protein